MCWSGEASAAIAIGGLSSAYFLKKKGNPPDIYIPTAYFVLMEGLQAFTYMVVKDPSGVKDLYAGNESWNYFFTILAIIHISFQPIFINMLGMHFIDKEVKQKIKKYVYAFAIMVALFNLARLLPFYETLGRCDTNGALCSHTETCAYLGQWHIGWNVMLNGFNEGWIWYILAAFILPTLYGAWKWAGYHYMVGPFLASLTTSDINERPAVWCLFSTMIIALMVNTRLRQYIYVKKWPFWDKIKGIDKNNDADLSPKERTT